MERLRHYFLTYKLVPGEPSTTSIEAVYDRDHLIQSSTSGVEVSFPFDNFRVEELSENVMLVTYENTVSRDGESQRARRSSVWVSEAEGWRLRFQQATTLPD